LSHAELRSLAEQRRHLIGELLDQAQAHAADADLRLTPAVLLEVEATLQAALVDLAGALTIRNGRLVRPLSHAGFGPRPRAAVRAIRASEAQQPPEEAPAEDAIEAYATPVADELAARRRRNSTTQWTVEVVEGPDAAMGAPETSVTPQADKEAAPATEAERQTRRDLLKAEEALAVAEAAHWQSEFELADAEAAVEAADDVMSTLDTKRIEARRDRVTAQRHLAEAQSRQRHAVNALADARERLDAARRTAGEDE
jgi:hypothetical protein